jgi:hypothetical protein
MYFELQGGQRRISTIQDHERNYNRVFGAFHLEQRFYFISHVYAVEIKILDLFGKIK